MTVDFVDDQQNAGQFTELNFGFIFEPRHLEYTCTSACTILLVLGPWLGVHRTVCVAVIRKWGDLSKSLWKVYKVGLGPVSELKQGGLMKLAPSFMQTLVQKHGNRAGLFRSMDIEIQEVINT